MLPRAGGAYALLIRLPRPLPVSFGAARDVRLAPGRYLYCGSAYGPGGLAARVGRHLRKCKPMHWHVDQLTARGHVDDVLTVVGGRECDLVDRFALLPGTRVPLPGFGSADCRSCASHLLAVPEGFAFV